LIDIDYHDGNYYPPPPGGNPYYFNNAGPGYYRPMMPRGYPMAMPIPPGQVPYAPGGYPPQMYPMPPDMRPPFQGAGKDYVLTKGGPMMPYMMVQGANGQWYPANPAEMHPPPNNPNPNSDTSDQGQNYQAEDKNDLDVQVEDAPEEVTE
jgi:hypothetical protein